MRLTARSALLVVVLTTLPVLASCGAATPTPTPDGPSAQSVAWVDGVCGTVRPFVVATATTPQLGTGDAKAALSGLSTYFGNAATALDGSISGLTATAPAPVPGGAEILKKVIGTYSALRATLQDAKTKVDAVDVANPESLSTALPAAVAGLPAGFDPTADLMTDPELGRAVGQAANCKALPAIGG